MSYAPQSALDAFASWTTQQINAINTDIDRVIMPQLSALTAGQNTLFNKTAVNQTSIQNINAVLNNPTTGIKAINAGLMRAYNDVKTLSDRIEQTRGMLADLAGGTLTGLEQRPVDTGFKWPDLGSFLPGVGTGALIAGAAVLALLLLRK